MTIYVLQSHLRPLDGERDVLRHLLPAPHPPRAPPAAHRPPRPPTPPRLRPQQHRLREALQVLTLQSHPGLDLKEVDMIHYVCENEPTGIFRLPCPW